MLQCYISDSEELIFVQKNSRIICNIFLGVCTLVHSYIYKTVPLLYDVIHVANQTLKSKSVYLYT